MKTRNTKLRPLALACGFVALMGSVGAQAASIPNLKNTGEGFNEGDIDTNYVLDDQAANVYDNNGKVTFDNKWAVASGGPWLANTPGTSRWLTADIVPPTGPTTQCSVGTCANQTRSVAPGLYEWTYTFDLTGFLPSTASLTGRFSADNRATVRLNGGPIIGATFLVPGPTPNPFQNWYNFSTLNTGSIFLPNLNTLTFLVTNDSGSSGNPTGLRVEFTNSSVSAVPLPPAALLFGSVLLGAGVFGRKKLFNKSDSQVIAG